MDHYAVLGVAPQASPAELAEAYRRGLDEMRAAVQRGEPADQPRLEAMRAAWQVLGDPPRRAAYDASRGAVPSAPTPAPRRGDDAPRRLQFEFTGDGGEYFRIWIVNLVLSILTLGIYSAWAKVRREQYFHRHLRLDGAGFDYHGDPKAILKGRAIAVGLLMLLSIAEQVGPLAYALALLALAPAVPWLLVRALRFRAHNTSYSGLRFGFVGETREAAKTVLGYGLLVPVSFGLALPLFLQRVRVWSLNNFRFGAAPFLCEVTAGQYYRIYLMPAGAMLLLFFVLGVVSALGAAPVAGVLFFLGILLLALLVRPYLTVRISNAVWGATTLAGNRFDSSMELRGYIKVVAGNAVMLVLTLGFFWPWAMVRLARYRAERTGLTLTCSRDEFLAGEVTSAAATGEEVADLFDVDIGA